MGWESRVFLVKPARKRGQSASVWPHYGSPLLPGGLMWNRSLALAALLLALACTDRSVTPPPPDAIPAADVAPSSGRPEALAKMVAKGLKNPAFRAYVKAQLDASPYVEHKLQFETFLAANSGRALREIAGENATTNDALVKQAK